MAVALESTPNLNEVRLTDREIEVLVHAVDGKSARQIADDMYVSKRTVDFHLGNIYNKLQVSNRIQAMRMAVRLGLVKIKVRT